MRLIDADELIQSIENAESDWAVYADSSLIIDFINLQTSSDYDSIYNEAYINCIEDIKNKINAIGYVLICLDCLSKAELFKILEEVKDANISKTMEHKDQN